MLKGGKNGGKRACFRNIIVWLSGTGYTEYLNIGFQGSATSFGDIAQAFYGGLWAFDGW